MIEDRDKLTWDSRRTGAMLWSQAERDIINNTRYLKWESVKPNEIHHEHCKDLAIVKARLSDRTTMYTIGIYRMMPRFDGEIKPALMQAVHRDTFAEALYEFGRLFGRMEERSR
jgi:hypothetical protein